MTAVPYKQIASEEFQERYPDIYDNPEHTINWNDMNPEWLAKHNYKAIKMLYTISDNITEEFCVKIVKGDVPANMAAVMVDGDNLYHQHYIIFANQEDCNLIRLLYL